MAGKYVSTDEIFPRFRSCRNYKNNVMMSLFENNVDEYFVFFTDRMK